MLLFFFLSFFLYIYKNPILIRLTLYLPVTSTISSSYLDKRAEQCSYFFVNSCKYFSFMMQFFLYRGFPLLGIIIFCNDDVVLSIFRLWESHRERPEGRSRQ